MERYGKAGQAKDIDNMAHAFCMLGKEDKNTDLHSEYVILIRENDQQDAHLFLINLFQLHYPLHVSN